MCMHALHRWVFPSSIRNVTYLEGFYMQTNNRHSLLNLYRGAEIKADGLIAGDAHNDVGK